MKPKIFFATNLRGFFRHLVENKKLKYEFVNESHQYEDSTQKNSIKYKLFKSFLADELGIIWCIKAFSNSNYLLNASYNKFLKSNKPYFICLENPTALFHYKLRRNKSYLGKKKIKQLLSDPQLKAIVCMSRACHSTLEYLHNDIKQLPLCFTQIYPYVPLNSFVNNNTITKKSLESQFKMLYVTQSTSLIPKGILEIIQAYKILIFEKKLNISLTVITNIRQISPTLYDTIRDIPGVIFLDFQFSFVEMEKIYSEHHILLHPTSMDSSSLTILESIKAGLPVITTTMYAIPEMVQNDINGYLTVPHWHFFDNNNIPNKQVWNHRKKTIFSTETDRNLIEFLCQKIEFLCQNREVLKRFSLNSWYISQKEPFSEEYITSQWNDFIDTLNNQEIGDIQCLEY